MYEPSRSVGAQHARRPPESTWLDPPNWRTFRIRPTSIDMYLPGLPALANDLRGPDWQVQLTLSACLLGLAGGQIIAGPLSDSYGRRGPLLLGMLVYAVASLLCSFAPSVPVLIVLRLVQGMAGATGIVIARAIVRDLYAGAAVARFFALSTLVSGAAPIIAPILGGLLLTFTTWHTVFLVLAGVGVLLFGAVTLWLRETLPPEHRQTGGLQTTRTNFGILLRDRHFIGYALASGLAYAALFSYISGSPFVYQSIYGVSPQVFSMLFAINALGIIVASQISGRLVGRVEARVLLACGLVGVLAGGVLLVLMVQIGAGLTGVAAGFFLTVASVGLVGPNATALGLADHGRIAGSASGLIGVLQYLIGAIVSPLAGIVGISTAMPVALAITAVGAGGFAVFAVLTRAGGDKMTR